ncbi:hydrogenase [Salinisphaera orenii MK-B5]|uniref:hydroxymethylpyrimidine kinase n=1 Tax=Salinisphaera orenii MK-B5 TaxID=856730 RepID=A0A423PQA8_9GAMM|nr:hydroxymethylpyrimidine/phosphomethylpyrimidine kinase [Salinisphaera orenii]ROO27794.1 hydrogenase [Salinisphaera orenii MK-B5]
MTRPNILVIAGHDPSGGAGIQADIESAAANGAHAATVVTLLTCQDTTNVYGVSPVEIGFFRRCLDTAIADMSFGAIKIGVVADVAQVAAIAELVQARPDIPLVVDPVLRAAGGGTLAGDAVGQALRDQLFAHATVITPNAAEARLLCDGESELARCGERLSRPGGHALITGGDEDGAAVVNRGFVAGRLAHTYEWPRVPGVFHGSGCTLASAIAARLACGDATERALAQAQDYTWRAIEHGFAAGRGQRIPDRRPLP